ncbi:hypothetical protein CJ20_057 [Escherichia phage CJ20]|nr:hypothetical protein CJ20_057 [Escherichia phage CJ20]
MITWLHTHTKFNEPIKACFRVLDENEISTRHNFWMYVRNHTLIECLRRLLKANLFKEHNFSITKKYFRHNIFLSLFRVYHTIPQVNFF